MKLEGQILWVYSSESVPQNGFCCPLLPINGGKCNLSIPAGIPTPTPFLTGKNTPIAGRFPAQIRFCAVNTLFIYSMIILQSIHTNRRFPMLQ
jgi:hypothetical protein